MGASSRSKNVDIQNQFHFLVGHASAEQIEQCQIQRSTHRSQSIQNKLFYSVMSIVVSSLTLIGSRLFERQKKQRRASQ